MEDFYRDARKRLDVLMSHDGLFLHRHRDAFAHNPRMFQMVRGLGRLSDLDDLIEQGPRG